MFSRVRGDAYCIAPPIVTDETTLDQIPQIMAEATKAVLG
jgi:adenosylmethionine-8-amino-7-oxononanoate aminotransferase